MLNLSMAMLQSILLLTLLFQDPTVSITSPQNGQVIRGQVEILGAMNVPDFASAELAFGFSDSIEAWFTIQTFSQPVVDSPLAVWDTTSVTDGDYELRLRVTLQDGSVQDVIISGVQIRNDSPESISTVVATETPVPDQLVTATSVPPTATLFLVQPTSLPSNPAALTTPAVYSLFGRGALAVLVLFVIVSFILRLRKD